MQTFRSIAGRIAASMVAASLVVILAACGARTAHLEHVYQPRTEGAGFDPVLTGLDVLERDEFELFEGRRLGLIANHSAINRRGEHLLDLLWEREGIEIVALLAPEHGFRGTLDERVTDGVDEQTGLPIYSLYGETRAPTAEMLEGVDMIVFDIQDIGARFYTYISTMGASMKIAAELGIDFVVLDRPNPIQGIYFDGPIQDDDLLGGFTSYISMPVTHGMTVGEIARLMHEYHDIQPNLLVVPMENWQRDMFWDETGLPWVNPSPNMRSQDEMLLYTLVALTEGNRDISVGRGTDRPFEYLGAPWVDGDALTAELRSRDLPGVWVMRQDFIPRLIDIDGTQRIRYQFTDEVCHGVRFVVNDRHRIDPVASGVHMLDALLELHPDRYTVERLRGLVGAQWVIDALEAREHPDAIIQRWRTSEEFRAFAERRASVLIY